MKFKNFLLSLKVLALSSLLLAAGCKKSNDTEETKLAKIQSRAKFVADSIIAIIPTSIVDIDGLKTYTYKDGHRETTGISVIKDKITEPENSSSAPTILSGQEEPKEGYENIDVDAGSVPYLISLAANWLAFDGWVVKVTHMSMAGSPASNTELLSDGTTVTVNRTLVGTTYNITPALVPSILKTLKWKSGLNIRVTVTPPGGPAVSTTDGMLLEYTRTLNALYFAP